jgi:hypothetical protein
MIMSMKNSNDTIGNRTRDLPAGSAVPEPTAPHITDCQLLKVGHKGWSPYRIPWKWTQLSKSCNTNCTINRNRQGHTHTHTKTWNCVLPWGQLKYVFNCSCNWHLYKCTFAVFFFQELSFLHFKTKIHVFDIDKYRQAFVFNDYSRACYFCVLSSYSRFQRGIFLNIYLNLCHGWSPPPQ